MTGKDLMLLFLFFNVRVLLGLELVQNMLHKVILFDFWTFSVVHLCLMLSYDWTVILESLGLLCAR